MNRSDEAPFVQALTALYSLYRAELSDAVTALWWQAMRGFELAAVRDAFARHTMNPDVGQYLPKPADVVRELGGTSSDAALLAWHKVVNALRNVGTYESVAFDDPIIHRVLLDLGGWVRLGQTQESEMPFVERRFRNAYRAWRARGMAADVVAYLPGLIETQNSAQGFPFPPPRLIGERTKALEELSQLLADRMEP